MNGHDESTGERLLTGVIPAEGDVVLEDLLSEADEAVTAVVVDEGGTIVPMFASYVFATSDKLGYPDQMASNWDLDGERWMERSPY